MSFAIVSAISPDYAHAQEKIIPTWYANSGASEIVIHRVDEGSWTANTIRRNELLCEEIIQRSRDGQKVLRLDADCLVVRDLSAGFSREEPISVTRWPDVNMGVTFFNTGVRFPWRQWISETLDIIHEQCSGRKDSTCECDQIVWRPRLHLLKPDLICRLPEWEWNYNHFDRDQWDRELPGLRDIVRVIHLKGHGQWPQWKFDFVKNMFPEEMACLS